MSKTEITPEMIEAGIRRSSNALAQKSARERLARCLFEEMDFLDPDIEELSWDMMSDFQKELFRSSVDALLGEKTDLLIALNLPDNK